MWEGVGMVMKLSVEDVRVVCGGEDFGRVVCGGSGDKMSYFGGGCT